MEGAPHQRDRQRQRLNGWRWTRAAEVQACNRTRLADVADWDVGEDSGRCAGGCGGCRSGWSSSHSLSVKTGTLFHFHLKTQMPCSMTDFPRCSKKNLKFFNAGSVNLCYTYRCSLWWNKAVNIFLGDASIWTRTWRRKPLNVKSSNCFSRLPG